MAWIYISDAKWMENCKGSTCNASDDRWVQQRAHKICHHHMPQTKIMKILGYSFLVRFTSYKALEFFHVLFSCICSVVKDIPLKKPKRIVDVGCGIGGSSRYLANKYGAQVQGITLSTVQAKRAQDLAMSEALADKVSFQVADAIDQPFPDGQFDLVWSIESGEHMPDKEKFVRELARVAAPGGTIIIVTWCHRDLSPSEEELKPDEINLLNKLCSSFYLPKWCSAAEYVDIAKSLSLEDVKAADWSENVAPFWPAVVQIALTWHGFISLMRSGWRTVRGALAMPLMIDGYSKGIIKFAIITCRKPK